MKVAHRQRKKTAMLSSNSNKIYKKGFNAKQWKICDEITGPKTLERGKAYPKKICDKITAPKTLKQEKAYTKKICNKITTPKTLEQ